MDHPQSSERIVVGIDGSDAAIYAAKWAVTEAVRIGAIGSDAVALILFHHAERPVGLFSLDGHPHLKAVAIDPLDLGAYRALTATGS